MLLSLVTVSVNLIKARFSNESDLQIQDIKNCLEVIISVWNPLACENLAGEGLQILHKINSYWTGFFAGVLTVSLGELLSKWLQEKHYLNTPEFIPHR